MPEAQLGPARVRARLVRITDLLEDEFGRPRRHPDSDLVGSLVATILSQNTSDVNSERAYLALRERFPRWEEVERAGARSIAAAIKSGGLARVKAGRIRDILREIRDETGELDLGFLRARETGEVIDYLLGFKGVGTKTAACVALFDLGRDVVPVDTHVHRIVGRLGLLGRPRTRDATYDALQPVFPVSLEASVRAWAREEPASGWCGRLGVRGRGAGSAGEGPGGPGDPDGRTAASGAQVAGRVARARAPVAGRVAPEAPVAGRAASESPREPESP